MTEQLLPFQDFAATYLATLLIAAACALVGVYVICKRVVFVGVALAEVSALGIGLGFLSFALVPASGAFGVWWQRSGPALLAAVLAAGTVLWVAWRQESSLRPTSRESAIGVIYAAAGAIALLAVWKSSEGLEELRHLLHGDVLFVERYHVALLAGMAAVVLAVHLLWRRPLLLAAYDPDMAQALGLRPRAMTVVLFLSIGAVISLSTWVGGLMVVFGVLVVAPFAALRAATRFLPAVALSMLLGLGGASLGLLGAVRLDYPLPPAVVAALLLPLGFGTVCRWIGRPRLLWALAVPGGGVTALGAVIATAAFFGHPLLARAHAPRPLAPENGGRAYAHRRHDAGPAGRRVAGTREAASSAAGAANAGAPLQAHALADLASTDGAVLAEALSVVRSATGAEAAAAVRAIAARAGAWPADLRVEAGRTLRALGERHGAAERLWLGAASDAEAPPFVRDDAASALREVGAPAAAYDALAGVEAPPNRAALAAWGAWLESRR